MKKIFFGIVALVAMVATSCQQSLDELNVVGGGDATVTFNVGAGSRAYSDGKTATHLQWAVYDAAGNLLPALQGEKTDFQISTTVEFQLTTGNTYYVLFWATAPNAPYTVDWAAKSMTVNYTGAKSNEETRDAFYKYHEFTVSGSQTETVELKRPFAQLNIGTSDLEASEKAGHKVTHAMVEVTAYEKLNFATGAVENEAVRTFAYEAIPGTSEVFPVNDAENDYLAMNYLLMSSTKETFDVTFTYSTDATGANAKSRIVGSVPFQRNHRTNLYGQLLTSDVAVNVEIKPEYDDPMHEPSELQLAAAFGGEVTLTKDVVLTSPLEVSANMVLNLNGKTLSAATAKGDGAVVEIAEGASVELNGGTIASTAENGDAAINNAGSLVLKNVTVNGAPVGTTGYPEYAINTTGTLVVEEGTTISSDRGAIELRHGSNVTINGGNIEVTNALNGRSLTSYVIAARDTASKLTINGGNFTQNYAPVADNGTSVICPWGATIDIYAGNFVCAASFTQGATIHNYMGAGSVVNVYGGTFSDDAVTKKNNLADGYKAIEKDGKYYVVAAEADAIVANDTELSDALKAGNTTILMKAGTYDTNNFDADYKTLTLKGIEDGVKIFVNQTNNVALGTFDGSNVTFENLTLETVGGLYKGFARMNGTYKNCQIENCYFTQFGNHEFVGCTLNAPVLTGSQKNEHCVWTYGAAKVTFTDCVFNYSDRCVNVYVDNGGNTPGITSDVAFTNCKFNTENTASEGAVEVNSSPFTAGVEVVLNGCTAPAYGKLVYVSRWDGKKGANATILVDGEVVAGLASILENAAPGSTVVLSENANLGTVAVSELKDVTIEGNGSVMIFKTDANTKIKNVTLNNVNFEYTGATADCGIVIDANAQIDNLVLEGCNFTGTGAKAGRGLSGLNNNASIEIKNCTFKDLGYPIYAWGSYKALTIEGCTFENIKSWAIMPQSGFNGDLTVTGCNFNNCLGGGLVKAGTLTAGHTFTFTNNTINGCTIAGDHNWFQFNVSAGTAVISGNTKDGAAWTPGVADGLK